MIIKLTNLTTHTTRTVRSLIVLIWLMALAFSVKGQNFSKVTVSAFEPLINAQSEWVDFNNDGLLDLFVTGTDNLGAFKNTVFINNGDDTFNVISLDALDDVAYDFSDYNNDGFTDIAISGRNSSSVKSTKIYRNNSGSSFTEINFNLTDLSSGGIIWNDLDNDGDPDLLLTGLDNSDSPATILYEFDGTNYNVVSTSLPALSDGAIRITDANNDDRWEIVLSGLNNIGQTQTVVYTVDNNLNTTLYTDGLDNTTFNDMVLADYNEDGFSDVLQSGSFGSIGELSGAELYDNDGIGYTNISSPVAGVPTNQPLQDVFSSSVDFGDMNNDGLSDIFLTGIDGGGLQYFNFYVNSSPSYTFSLTATGAEKIFSGDVAIGDYDNDGDLDFFQVGNSDVTPQSNLFESDQAATTANAAPSVPTNLMATVDGDSVRLTWDRSTDDLTNQNSITYNIYISEDANATNLFVSPMASTTTGFRLNTKDGNAGHKNFKSINDLPEGRYYWSVQAIDNGFKGSDFATEGSFAICDPFEIGADTAICAMESITLSAGEAGDIVRWVSVTDGELEPNALTLNYQVLKKDTIVAELTRPFGCTVTDSIIVDIIDLPDFTLGSDTAICFEESIILNVDATQVPDIDSVNWYSTNAGGVSMAGLLLADNQTFDYQVTTDDIIIAEVFNTSGCVSTNSITIDVIDLPDFSLGNDTAVCFMENIELTVDATQVPDIDSVNWYSLNNGGVVMAGLLLSDNQTFDYQVLTDDQIIAEVFNSNKCVNYDTIAINILALPDFSLGNDTAVCFMENIELNVDASQVPDIDSVNWYSLNNGGATMAGLLLADNQTFDYQVLTDDQIIAEVFNTNNCVNYDTIAINTLALPAFTLGNDTAVCFMENIELSVDASQVPDVDSVNWFSLNNGGVTMAGLLLADNQTFNYQVLTDDQIIAEVFNTNNCVNYDTIAINTLALPSFSLGNDTAVCFMENIELTVDASQVPDVDSVNWFSLNNGGVSTAGLLLADNQTFDYQVLTDDQIIAEVFNTNNCVNYDTIAINTLALPDFSLGNDTAVCFMENIELTVDASQVPDIDSVNWFSLNNGGVSTAGLLLADNQTFDYQVLTDDQIIAEVFNTNNCVNYDTIIINTLALPDFTLGNDTAVCFMENIELTVDASQIADLDSVNWYSLSNGGVTMAGLLLADNQTFDYQVLNDDQIIAEVFNTNNCVNYDTIAINTLALPDFSLGNDTAICFMENIILSVDVSQVADIDSVNWYSLNNGGVAMAGLLLADNQTFDYQVLTGDQIIAEVFNTNNCVNYDTIAINTIALPDFTLGADTAICFDENIILEVTNTAVPNIDSVNWFSLNQGGVTTQGLLLADNQVFDYRVTESDEIIAEVFNTSGCVNYDTIVVNKIDLPVFEIGADTAICFMEEILLETAFDFDSVNWYSKSKNTVLEANSWFFNYQVLETDTIIAEVFNESRCVNYDTIIIEMNELPSFTLGDDRGVCFADTARLDVGTGWDEVNWFTFGNRILASNQESYDYRVEDDLTVWSEVFDANRCVNYDTITIEAFSLPTFDLGEDFPICFEDTINIQTNVSGADFVWTNQLDQIVSNDNFYKVVAQESTSLRVLATDENSCLFRDSIDITVNALPDFEITGDFEICAEDTVMLSVDFPSIETIVWSNPERNLQSDVTEFNQLLLDSERFILTITDTNGCTNLDTADVVVNQLPVPIVENDTLLCFGEELLIGGNYSNEGSLAFDWMPATFLSDNSVANPVSAPTEPISYTVTVTDDKGCVQQDSVYIEVNPEIILNAGGEKDVCIGDSVQIGGMPTAVGSRFPYSYSWSPTADIQNPTSSNPEVFPKEDRWYKLTVSTGRCATIEDSVFVTVNDLPIVEISPQQSIGSGSSVELVASGGVEYTWTPEGSLDDAEVFNPVASPLVTTTYTVEVVDKNGCISTADVTVLVQNELFIPSLFTPNGDGRNDTFKVFGSGIKELTLTIYDREGNPVFTSSDLRLILETGWDGTSNGSMLKNETYIWTISGSYFDGSRIEYNGSTRGIIKLVR